MIDPSAGHVRRGRRGFTVVEMLVVMSIFVIVLAALGAFFSSTTRAYTVTSERSEAIQDSEAVVQLLRYEIALAGYRGIGVDYDQPFTLDGAAADESVIVERGTDSDVLTIRYFEDRYLRTDESGVTESGERRVSFSVDTDGQTLIREERREVGGTVTTELLVGNITDLRVSDLVRPDRTRVSVADILSDASLTPERLSGLIVIVDFTDGRRWEFMVGLANPQVFKVRAL